MTHIVIGNNGLVVDAAAKAAADLGRAHGADGESPTITDQTAALRPTERGLRSR